LERGGKIPRTGKENEKSAGGRRMFRGFVLSSVSIPSLVLEVKQDLKKVVEDWGHLRWGTRYARSFTIEGQKRHECGFRD